MATKKVEMNVKTSTGYDVLHLKSQSDIIDYDNTASKLLATNVKDALDELKVATDSVVMVYTNAIVVASAFEPDNTYAGYSYKYDIKAKGSAQNLYSYVNFAPKEHDGGNYAQISKTSTDKVTIYAKAVPSEDFVIPYVVLYNATKKPSPIPSNYIAFNVKINKTISVELAGITATLTKSGSNKTETTTLATDGTCKFLVVGWGDGEYTVTFGNLPKKHKINPIIQSAVQGGTYTLTGSFVPTKTLTVKIDQNNSNPETSVTYHDDATRMTPKSAEWDEFFGHKPCLLKNGQVVGYLNPNDYTKFEDGSSADITSGNSGDVMVEFPRRNLKISTSDNIVTITMTDDLDNFTDGLDCLAHKRDSKINDKFYLGAYHGYYDGKLRSLSGKTPTAEKTVGTFRTYAHNNGTGYEQFTLYQLFYLQSMYILKYKNLDSQTALGRGYVDNYNGSARTTGTANQRGMDWGETTGKQPVKLFGIEDFWGNVCNWVDGFYYDGSYNLLTATNNFQTTGSGYKNNGKGADGDIRGYMSQVQGDTNTGFIPKQRSGSETTYYCDFGDSYSVSVARFGGSWNEGSRAGCFQLYVHNSSQDMRSGIGARLSFYN